MAAFIATLTEGSWLTLERLRIVSWTVLIFTVVVLAALAVTAHGSVDIMHRPLGTDFSSFYAAGKAVLAGEPGAPYVPALQHAREQAQFGVDTPFYGWLYPPFFLLVAAALALLPYPLALLVWQGGTLALYLFAIAMITREVRKRHPIDGLWWLPALGFPAVFVNFGHGQNGFLSAGLIGLGLVNLEKRPWLAGVLFGLLAYKPQLGLMIPVALLAAGRWRTIVAATATVGTMVLVVVATMGTETTRAFLDSMAYTRTELLEGGGPGWEKIQTAFAWVRLWGGSLDLAYAVQGAVTLMLAAGIAWLWRSPARFAWKAAALAVAAVVAAPFSLDYDMMILAVAIAFLAADGLEHGFAPWEKTLLATLWIVPLVARTVALAVHVPLGVMAMLAMIGFILARAPSITSADRTPARF